jgi:hypothetical protein
LNLGSASRKAKAYRKNAAPPLAKVFMIIENFWKQPKPPVFSKASSTVSSYLPALSTKPGSSGESGKVTISSPSIVTVVFISLYSISVIYSEN